MRLGPSLPAAHSFGSLRAGLMPTRLLLRYPSLRRLGAIAAAFASLYLASEAYAQVSEAPGTARLPYPVIERLTTRDVVFRQLQDALAQGYAAENGAGDYPDLFLCQWTARGGEDLFDLAARLNLPYDTLATLNGYERPRVFGEGERMLIPSIAGIFIAQEPRTDLDRLLQARGSEGKAILKVEIPQAGIEGTRPARRFSFIPGSRLYTTERSFFLVAGFRMPLPEGVLTSRFGMRVSPIDGHDRLHKGIDLAAPAGTSVLAAREGRVDAIQTDAVLGLHVILDHGAGLGSVYGHLGSCVVELNQRVGSGTIVGTVGSSGLSTGPHLHFEIRVGGAARDPAGFIPGLRP